MRASMTCSTPYKVPCNQQLDRVHEGRGRRAHLYRHKGKLVCIVYRYVVMGNNIREASRLGWRRRSMERRESVFDHAQSGKRGRYDDNGRACETELISYRHGLLKRGTEKPWLAGLLGRTREARKMRVCGWVRPRRCASVFLVLLSLFADEGHTDKGGMGCDGMGQDRMGCIGFGRS